VIRKALRQETSSTSQPPKTGPTAIAVALSAPQVPMAFALSFPSNDAPTMASDAGTRSAPPTPCTARAATSCPASGARAPLDIDLEVLHLREVEYYAAFRDAVTGEAVAAAADGEFQPVLPRERDDVRDV
jgi:hypothetical protein